MQELLCSTELRLEIRLGSNKPVWVAMVVVEYPEYFLVEAVLCCSNQYNNNNTSCFVWGLEPNAGT